MKKRIGILTGGGDAPGLNGIIESCCRTLCLSGFEVIGIMDGFEGIFNQTMRTLTIESVSGRHQDAGTLLGTSNKSSTKSREAEFFEKYQAMSLSGLIVAGGDGTFSALQAFAGKIPIIGVPKTIDNDLSGTELTFGFDTACAVVAEAVDSLRATAEAHRRVLIVETMGRTAGWIALGGGLASYADVILLPERPFSRENLCGFIQERKKNGGRGLMICVSEGAKALGEEAQVSFQVSGSPEPDRLGGISQTLARWIESKTGWESRNVILGHLQRSRHPTTTDRFLTLEMGIEAARMAAENAWGQAVVYREGRIKRAPLLDLMQAPKRVTADHQWLKLAKALEIFV